MFSYCVYVDCIKNAAKHEIYWQENGPMVDRISAVLL